MPVFSWIAKSSALAGIYGDAGAAAFAKDFIGSFAINLGTSTQAFIGERQTHIFGNDIKLVSCGAGGGIGGALGLYLNTPLASIFNLLGAYGDVSLVYGPRTGITYGGPKTDILRGRQIKKTSFRSPTERYFTPAFGVVRDAPLDGSLPADPTGAEAIANDEITEYVIVCLSTLLNDITLALELALRFKYPKYDPKNASARDEAWWLNTMSSTLSDMFIGIIYGIETTSVQQQLGERMTNWLALATIIVARLLSYPANLAKAIKGYFERMTDSTKNALMYIGGALLILGVIALIITLSLRLAGKM